VCKVAMVKGTEAPRWGQAETDNALSRFFVNLLTFCLQPHRIPMCLSPFSVAVTEYLGLGNL
jgi:hypothetical protein